MSCRSWYGSSSGRATKLGHLEDALAAEELELSEDEMRQLEGPYIPHVVAGHQ